VIFFSIP